MPSIISPYTSKLLTCTGYPLTSTDDIIPKYYFTYYHCLMLHYYYLQTYELSNNRQMTLSFVIVNTHFVGYLDEKYTFCSSG